MVNDFRLFTLSAVVRPEGMLANKKARTHFCYGLHALGMRDFSTPQDLFRFWSSSGQLISPIYHIVKHLSCWQWFVVFTRFLQVFAFLQFGRKNKKKIIFLIEL